MSYHQNKVRIRGRIYTAEPRPTTQEDNHFGIEAIWELTNDQGVAIPRGLVKWFSHAGGGWGYWPGEGQDRVRIETHDIEWLEVDEGMARWLKYNKLPPSRLTVVEDIARLELGIETLEVRGRDHLDFYDVGVVGLRRALERAYDEGRSSSHG